MHTGFGFVEIDGVTYTHDIVDPYRRDYLKTEKEEIKGIKR